MSKRFVETTIWDDAWFQNLPSKYKHFWRYLCDKCDLAGDWKVNFPLASFQISEPNKPEMIIPDEAIKLFNQGKERVIDCGSTWFILGFIEFQYGKLNSKVPFHKRIIEKVSKLKDKFGTRVEPRVEPILEEKERDKERVKEKDKEGGMGETGFKKFWSLYPKKKSKTTAIKAWLKLKPNEQLTESILQAVERAKTSDDWLKEKGKFIPYPATWLNGGCWEDEITETEAEFTGVSL